MSTPQPPAPEQRRAVLCAAMDGQAAEAEQACRLWRSDAAARADWHVYHLIGDLMRSDEHRADAARDARLLARVRDQLAREPVVLAPTASAPANAFALKRRARAWMVPTAVAAGFAAVAGSLLVTRVADPPAAALVAGPALQAPQPQASVAAVQAQASVAAVQAQASVAAVQAQAAAAVAGPEGAAPMIRSAELDRYLAAHRQYANGALQVPGGAVRQAAVAAPGR